MTRHDLQVSLALWERRHTYRQSKLDYAHLINDAAGITKWHKLLVESGRSIRLRRAQLGQHPRRSDLRDELAALALRIASEYRRAPSQFHYLAGGKPSTDIHPPFNFGERSDCSQFAVNLYREVGSKACPGVGSWLYSNTVTIAARGGGGVLTTNPGKGDLGLYGSRWAPHHVEVVTHTGPLGFVGHGSPPVDTLTPGLPSFYLTFPLSLKEA